MPRNSGPIPGNTSACAEKDRSETCISAAGEIPPRVRRRDPWRLSLARGHGNTSACAEKSAGAGKALAATQEIPPRVRRRESS